MSSTVIFFNLASVSSLASMGVFCEHWWDVVIEYSPGVLLFCWRNLEIYSSYCLYFAGMYGLVN